MFNKRFMWIQLIVLAALYRESSCARELRFLGIVSETGGYKNAGACLPAIDMALEDIKRLGNILKDYNLTYKWENDKCHPGTSLYRMFKRLSEDSPYHMLLGPPCSIASKATAQVSYMWNLTQLSSESSSPILSDRKRFPRFFRLTVPDQLVNIPRAAMLKEYNWERVATIHQAREFFAAITDDFVQRIKHTNISIIAQEIFGNDVYARVENLKRQDARIILTAMYEDKAIELLCAAYKVGLYGPKIVWILLGWYTATFWQTNLHNIECTAQEMALVAEGVFMTGGLYKNSIEERGIANLTVSEFEHRYFNHPNYDPKWTDSDVAVPYLCYDHIWTAALALECTAQNLRQLGHPKPLHEFTYADGDIGEMIFSCMGNVSLTGVSGRTSFDGSDKEENVAVIERIQAGKRDLLGLCRQNNFEWIDGALKWKNGIIPTDSAQIRNEETQLPLALYALMITLAALGVCLSVSFLGFNIVYRNNRSVKLSSPNINNLLLVGCVLCYLTVMFKTIGHDDVAVCRARTYSFSLGFTITFGSLFSKTWRVHRIFINKRLSRVHIKDRHLLIVIGLLVGLILTLLIISDSVGPQEIQYKFLSNQVFESADGTEIRPFVKICWSKYSSYFNWALYIIQGALLTFGTFLAWETRNVTVKELNDSQKIGMCLYNVVTLSAVGVLLTLLLEDQEILLYGLTSGFVILGTTVTQMIIFVPKVRAVASKLDVEPISTLASTLASNTAFPTRSLPSGQSSLKVETGEE